MLEFFTLKFYVMGKALSGKLFYPCDRSCLGCFEELGEVYVHKLHKNMHLQQIFQNNFNFLWQIEVVYL